MLIEFQNASKELQLAASFGILTALYFLYKLLSFIYVHFLMPGPNFKYHKGRWAIITGASWGIGYGFSLELASRGMNVILIARSKERLEEVAKEIESKYKVKTRVIVFDFSVHDPTAFDKLADQWKDLDVSMLVNNVGVINSYAKFFLEHSAEEMDNLVHVNVNVLNHMTRVVLPTMLQKKKGTIIILSSESAHENTPTAYISVYAATKAYNLRLALGLSQEYGHKGIEVMAICPGVVTSKMSRQRKASLLICSERQLARDTINKLGRGIESISPYYRHAIQDFVFGLNQTVARRLVAYFMEQKRRLALKKMEQDAKLKSQ